MYQPRILLLVFFQAVFVLKVETIQFFKDIDTRNGYCETEDFGQFAVGNVAYNDTHCTRAVCMEGKISIQMCDVIKPPPGCTADPGPGSHPSCCLIKSCSVNL